MIDTIVLTLRKDTFSILDHNRFSPSTEGLYNPSSYYRLGGRANLICKQNPTVTELRNGNYKPRLTVTKRMNKYHQFEITLKIEFSIPKLLFGNNFDELEDTDFSLVISKLKQRLADMGVSVLEPVLADAPISLLYIFQRTSLSLTTRHPTPIWSDYPGLTLIND